MSVRATMLEPEHASYISGSISEGTDSFWTNATYGKLRRSTAYGYYASTIGYMLRSFSDSVTTICVCAKFTQPSFSGSYNTDVFLGLGSGNMRIIGVGAHYSSGSVYIRLKKWNTSTLGWDTLDTSSVPMAASSFRCELMIEDHGETARVRVWLRYAEYNLKYTSPHILVLDGTYDTRVSTLDIDGAWMGPTQTSTWQSFGCLIAADEPTHRYELFPHAPNAAGDVNDMTGDYTKIDETNADTTDYVESDADHEKILVSNTSLPANVTNVVAYDFGSLFSAGETGPSKVIFGYKKSGGSEVWTATPQTVGPAWENKQLLLPDNPFTVAEVNGLQTGWESDS